MSGSVNKVILVGNLGADPEIKTFGNGGKIANLRIATSETWNDKQSGEKRERTEWSSVTLNGDGLVGVAERFLKKGSKVYLEGKLQTRKWQDAQGNDRYTTEVVVSGFGGSLVMLDGPAGQRGGGNDDGWSAPQSGNGRSAGNAGNRSANNQQAGSQSYAGNADDLDDDMDSVPF